LAEVATRAVALDSFSLILDSCMSLSRGLNLVLQKGAHPSMRQFDSCSQTSDCAHEPTALVSIIRDHDMVLQEGANEGRLTTARRVQPPGAIKEKSFASKEIRDR
jgi:hypothetical protein